MAARILTPCEEVYKDGEDDTENQTCHDREVELERTSLKEDVTGKLSQQGYTAPEADDDTDNYY
jgi:hypothetical protein